MTASSRHEGAAYPPIEDHGVIGDLYTVALVALDGTIDFLCLPHFDSPSVFAALIDHEKGGRFRLAPALEDATHRQLYLPDSNVLLTRFLSEDGVAEVTDFMPVEEPGSVAHNLVREAKCIRGRTRFRMRCQPRFDYGRASHAVERRDDRCVTLISEGPGELALTLRASLPLRVRDGDVEAEFDLAAGETASFVLEVTTGTSDSPCAGEDYVQVAFRRTLDFWRRWTARSTYRGRWREAVNRSALALKLLCSQPHGCFVAAGTFGLPESPGGERNWDYRYVWIRDASFALYALFRLGYADEARAFMGWITERCAHAGGGDLQVLYGIDGRTDLVEERLAHLDGYRGSRPVRIGNEAFRQLQLDIYGELLDAIYLFDKYGEAISIDLWSQVERMLGWLTDNWDRSDQGIWETRAGEHQFLYSRVLCWVAFDRAARIAHRRSLPMSGDWIGIRDRIRQDVVEGFWDEELGAFTQCRGRPTLDASALALPLMRFVGPTDPRWLSTLRAIEEHLVEDSLVHRYREGDSVPDGVEGTEGTFTLCSFWYAESLGRSGDLQRARLTFERVLGYANHLGLFAEEIGDRGEHLGNFPQVFAHTGLISAAYDLDRRLDRSERTPRNGGRR